MESVGVQDFPALGRKICEVSAVEPDTVAVRVVVIYAFVPVGPHGIHDSAFEGVVGVNQKNKGFVAVRVDVGGECLVLSLD